MAHIAQAISVAATSDTAGRAILVRANEHTTASSGPTSTSNTASGGPV